VKPTERSSSDPHSGAAEPPASSRSWAVIGAGSIGLSVARRLAEAGQSVTVYEREPFVGGQAASFEVVPGVALERFYHHAFKSDRVLRRTFTEFGLGDRMTWSHPVTATLLGGEIATLDSPVSLLRFGGLPLVDRLRMGATLAALRLIPRGSMLEGRAAGKWLRRWMGGTAYDRIWRPLLEGKFGAAAESVAMPWFWARVHDRTASLGYPTGGFQQVHEAMAERVRSTGGKVLLAHAVESVEPAGGGFDVAARTSGGSLATAHYDAVISTLPPGLTARLTPKLPESWRSRYASRPGQAALCLILALDRAFTDTYWLNVNDPDFPFLVVVEQTNMRSPAEYGGKHLIYLGTYRDSADPILDLTVDEVAAAFEPALVRINPDFDRSWITDRWLFSVRDAQPIADVDFRDHIPPFETPLAGMFVCTIGQVYPHDRGQNYAIDLGERLAAQLLK
jgi:protoporphyrinogen oxidase